MITSSRLFLLVTMELGNQASSAGKVPVHVHNASTPCILFVVNITVVHY